MKYAVKFFKPSRHINDFDEIIIEYRDETSALLDFIKAHPHQRVIADLSWIEDIETALPIFKAAHQLSDNFTLRINTYQYGLIKFFKEDGIPFFFCERASTQDDILYFISKGVSDIYLEGDICFDIKNLSEYIHNHNTRVRVVPNIALSSCRYYSDFTKDEIDTFKFFFIRPEDIKHYEDYVDVCEFYSPIAAQDVLFEIYKSEKWKDYLGILIDGISEDIMNDTLPPNFGVWRADCRKRCMFNSQCHCKICDYSKDLGEVLKRNNCCFTAEDENNGIRINGENIQNNSRTTSPYDVSDIEDKIQTDYSE